MRGEIVWTDTLTNRGGLRGRDSRRGWRGGLLCIQYICAEGEVVSRSFFSMWRSGASVKVCLEALALVADQQAQCERGPLFCFTFKDSSQTQRATAAERFPSKYDPTCHYHNTYFNPLL